MSAEAAPHVRAVAAALPWLCLAVFVEIAGGNRVRCFSSTIDLVVVINHAGRFAREFRSRLRVHDRTTARPHDRTTARPHVRMTARPHDRTTTKNYKQKQARSRRQSTQRCATGCVKLSLWISCMESPSHSAAIKTKSQLNRSEGI